MRDGSRRPVGGLDVDRLSGGKGNDRVRVIENDIALGGAGNDTLSFLIPPQAPVVVNLDLSRITASVAGSIGYRGIQAGQFENTDVHVVSFLDGSSVIGSRGSDMMFAEYAAGTTGIRLVGGKGDDGLFGSQLADTISGGVGNDRISGGGGSDTLTGGKGRDGYYVGSGDPDLITDFRPDDYFSVQGSMVQGTNPKDPLRAGSAPTPSSARGQFLYDTDDGRLLYDADGTGAGAAEHLFTLRGAPTLSALNFVFGEFFLYPPPPGWRRRRSCWGPGPRTSSRGHPRPTGSKA